MSVGIHDPNALVHLLSQHLEWQEEIRDLLNIREVHVPPQSAQELEEQKPARQRIEELAKAQKRNEKYLAQLEQVVAELLERQRQMDEQLRILSRRVDELTRRVNELEEAQKQIEQHVESSENDIGPSDNTFRKTPWRIALLFFRFAPSPN